jgi:hypothetical protein
MMRWLFRPSMLLAVAAAALVGAFLITWTTGGLLGPSGPSAPVPLPVADGEGEIVWLYAATSSAPWERFVAGLRRVAQRLGQDFPGLEAQVGADAFPRQTFSSPQVALAFPGGRRLVFRWYKLTSDWKPRDWIAALLRRRPPPLAIIGGNTSDIGRDIAAQLADFSGPLPEARRPLLLLTQATADRVLPEAVEAGHGPPGEPDIEETLGVSSPPDHSPHGLYPDRTFRFCFSNKQMAAAVTRFVWSQDDLRPDRDPVYMVQWMDDSYSRDLTGGFWRALRTLVAESAVRQWGWAVGAIPGGAAPGLSGGPFPFDLAGRRASGFHLGVFPTPQLVDSSVGPFDRPNRFESKCAHDLLDLALHSDGPPRRPLLILTGQSGPCRRFLRGLERFCPQPARRFVVATGDGIAFNTVYRDRRVTWPIQDLPFPLVFFCHRNPVDREAGFRPVGGAPAGAPGGTAATGTEDILLYEDILEALAQAAATPLADADQLRDRLRAVRLTPQGHLTLAGDGPTLFGPHDGRRGGTGEHVVCLRPRVVEVPVGHGEAVAQVLPEATIEVWAWRAGADGGRSWQQVSPPLAVTYDGSPPEGGGAHEPD